MAPGRGPGYSDEEDAAILAGPDGESAEGLKRRVEQLGFPVRSLAARKQRKSELRKADGSAPRAYIVVTSGTDPQKLLARLRTLEIQEDEAKLKLAGIQSQLDALVKELAVVAVTAGDGLEDELADEIRSVVADWHRNR